MRVQIGFDPFVRGDPEARRAGQDDGGGGGLAAEEAEAADNVAVAAEADRAAGHHHPRLARAEVAELLHRLALAQQDLAGAAVQPIALVDEMARAGAADVLQQLAAHCLLFGIEPRHAAGDDADHQHQDGETEDDRGPDDRGAIVARNDCIGQFETGQQGDHKPHEAAADDEQQQAQKAVARIVGVFDQTL